MAGPRQMMDDIAVVGLGVRFPGNATSPKELWEVLNRKESQWSEFPKDRLNIDGYYHPSGSRQGSISFRGAHFLKQNIKAFDAPFFSIPTEEANAIDPQQRILLEVSYEALEHAGIRKEDIDGSDTAVYVGSFVKDYEQICLRDQDWSPQYAATGNGIAIMANRISYTLNLHGPSMTIDTGCSGSLIAVHLAAQSLRTGESSLAIAAGAGMILTPNTIMPMTALNFLSPDGKCFTFDARANGYGRGEGIGAVILKRLSDAVRDNDTIHAVIRASSTNQDGRTTGITLPSKEAQVANIRSIYANAGLSFDQTAYVECHGTGTQAGDWRELRAISETLGECRSVDNPIYVGSVKPNIGHLEGAAGIAGLIKGVLALEHGKIPPNIHFENGNPDIDFKSWKVKVATDMTNWPLLGLRRVSVNCFGFGGSNAHVVMDEAPAYLSGRGIKGNHSSVETSQKAIQRLNGEVFQGFSQKNQTASSRTYAFFYSAQDKKGVGRVMSAHLQELQNQIDDHEANNFLRDYAYTLGCRRSNLDWRGFVCADSLDMLVSKVQKFDNQAVTRSSSEKKLRSCFIFCGQGAQWAKMGQDLLYFAVFSASLEKFSAFLRSNLEAPFDLLEEMGRDTEESHIAKPEIAQPTTTALQLAFVDLMKSFDVLPKYVVGHSSGEIAAAYAAGALSYQDALRVSYYRGLAAASIPVRAPKLRGGMMVVGFSLSETEEYLASVKVSVQVACVNSPRSITISGMADDIAFIANDLRQRNVFCRVLDVKTAYHSTQMKLVEHDYRDALNNTKVNKLHESVTMVSTVTGKCLADSSELTGKYWARNMVSPVQYVAAIRTLLDLPSAQRPDTFIELGPGGVLRSPTSDIIAESGNISGIPYYSALERKMTGPESLMKMIGELWCRGCPINMKAIVTGGLDNDEPKCLSTLPTYVWDHSKEYWHESHLNLATRFRKYPRMDLIGAQTADCTPFEPRWRGFLRIPESPWIQDHQVQKTIVYPAAGMISMVLEGAKQLIELADSEGIMGYEICNMKIEKAILVPNNAHGLEVALNIKKDPDSTEENGRFGVQEFTIYSKNLDRPWERHASGSLRYHYKTGDWRSRFASHETAHKALEDFCTEGTNPRQLYEHLDAVGMNYGTSFQNITEVHKRDAFCVSKVKIPDTKSRMPSQFEYPHLIHPTTLDSMFQTPLAIKPVPMVPVFINSLFVSANLGEAVSGQVFSGHSKAIVTGLRDAECDIVMKHEDIDDCYVIIDGLKFTSLYSPSPSEGGYLPNHRNLCTHVVWEQDASFAWPGDFQTQVSLLAHKHPNLSVLQVGSETSVTQTVLGLLSEGENDAVKLHRYTICDKDHIELPHVVRERSLELYIEKLTSLADIKAKYHLLILCDKSKPSDLVSFLNPGGVLLKRANSGVEQIPLDDDDIRLDEAVRLTPEPSCIKFTDYESGTVFDMEVHKETTQLEMDFDLPTDVMILLPRQPSSQVWGFLGTLKKLYEARSKPFGVSLVSPDELQRNPSMIEHKIVMSLLDFTGSPCRSSSVYEWGERDFANFKIIQKHSGGVLWITRAAHMDCQNPKGAPIVALARTLMSEDPLTRFATLDLGLDSQLGDESVVSNVLRVHEATFGANGNEEPREMEYAELNGRLYIPRLVTLPYLNRLIEGDKNLGGFDWKPFCKESDGAKNVPDIQLTIEKPGLEPDSWYFTEFTATDLKPSEVEISLLEAPLTFLDGETIMGRTSYGAIGIDVRGRVKQVGKEVTGLAVGDEVIALAPGGSLKNTLHINGRLVKPTSEHIIPSLLISAYYALIHIGRARKGKTVFIHAGASAFGLVAVELALAIGAEVFATVLEPDSDQQRDALLERGVPKDHIFDAEGGSFVPALQTATNGQGVDICYSSTLLEFDYAPSIVRKCGIIVQHASKSASPPSMRAPMTPLTIVNFDLRELLLEDTEFVAEIFDDAVTSFHKLFVGSDRPSQLTKEFGIGDLQSCFEHIQDSPYLGFTSVLARNGDADRVCVRNDNITTPVRESIDPKGTYLLAGGLGGLGRSITELLITHGARNFAYLSRSGDSTESSKTFLNGLRERGINARAYAVDICDVASLSLTISSHVTADMPPVRGVFQCAAVIRDAVFDNMTFQDWDTAIKPKTVGSWNLLEAITSSGHNPFYVFLASSSGIIGSRGQANYAAGNCFQDSLARYCRQQGRHAVSVDLGPVLGAGMLAEDDEVLDILRASGFYGIRHSDFLKVIEHAITGETIRGEHMPTQVILGVGTGGIILQNEPADPYWSRTALYSYLNLIDIPPPDLTADATASNKDTKSMLTYAPSLDAATSIVCIGLTHMLAKAMNMLPEEVDVTRPPNAYGVDSLVAVGVRNWVLSSCAVQISVFEVLSESTIEELSSMIAEKGGYGTDRKN